MSAIVFDAAAAGSRVSDWDGSNLTKVETINSFFARFSPDGKKIAYIAGKFPETAVFIANADGSNQTNLTAKK